MAQRKSYRPMCDYCGELIGSQTYNDAVSHGQAHERAWKGRDSGAHVFTGEVKEASLA